MDMEISPPQLRNIKENAPSLPEEIIEEILSRLPVKSLLKFRCVSKSWRFLIGSKRFIKTHLQNSTKNTTFAQHKIILNCTPPYHGLKQCSLGSLLNEPFTDSFTFGDSLKIKIGSDESICLVGCSNGLVCILVERKYFVLWNPSTRMSKKLPDIDDKIKHGRVTKYGFGYDESNGDYRVFAIVSVFWFIDRYLAMCKVYSLKTNSWKVVKQRDSSPFSGTGKFACGKLHWADICLDSRWDIVSFDLNSQAYGMVEQPCYSEVGFRLSLGVLEGCLCVLCDYQKTHFDIWVMKHYGVKESWDKVVSVSYLHCPRRGQSLTLFYIGSNGEIILRCGSTFIIYNLKDNVLRDPQISNIASFHEVDIYIESLVSLAPSGEQEMQSPKIIA